MNMLTGRFAARSCAACLTFSAGTPVISRGRLGVVCRRKHRQRGKNRPAENFTAVFGSDKPLPRKRELRRFDRKPTRGGVIDHRRILALIPRDKALIRS